MINDPARILIVEDSPTRALELQNIFEWKDFEVVKSVDGEEALRSISKNRPDIVISDVIMPKMS
jgi:PleD family two-component response regulator